jgi:hypothetical protein
MAYTSGLRFSTLYIILLSKIHLLCSVLLVTHGMIVGNISRVFECLTRQKENKTTIELLQVLTSYISVFTYVTLQVLSVSCAVYFCFACEYYVISIENFKQGMTLKLGT